MNRAFVPKRQSVATVGTRIEAVRRAWATRAAEWDQVAEDWERARADAGR